MPNRITRVSAASFLLLLLAGCGSHQASSSTTSTSTTTTTTAVITVSFVQSVTDQLEHLSGDAMRVSYQAHQVTSQAQTYLRAAFSDQSYSDEVKALQLTIQDRYKDLLDTPGDQTETINALVSASPSCIFASGSLDNSLLFSNNRQTIQNWIWLTPKNTSNDPEHLNGTGWQIAGEPIAIPSPTPGGPSTPPTDPCPQSPPSTTSTTANPNINVAVIPPTITLPYVQAVVNELFKEQYTALNLAHSANAVTPQVKAYIRATDSPNNYNFMLDGFNQTISSHFSGLIIPLGLSQETIKTLETASPSCIFAAGINNSSRVLINSAPPHPDWLWLQPKNPADDPQHLNHTAWEISGDFGEPSTQGKMPANSCDR